MMMEHSQQNMFGNIIEGENQEENENVPSELPPLFCFNPRELIEPQQILVSEMYEELFASMGKENIHKRLSHLWLSRDRQRKPKPLYPISISWSPEYLCFEINKKPVVHRLWVSNRSARLLYIHICGLWDETAKFGAGWQCYPRTRLLLAPGLITEIFIRACPRDDSPVPYAYLGLQLAAAHKRDQVIGYFLIPMRVTFYNFSVSAIEEGE